MKIIISAMAEAPSLIDKEDRVHERLLETEEDEEAGSNFGGSHAAEEQEAAAARARLSQVDEEIGKVTGEVRELARFAGLNHTAFGKVFFYLFSFWVILNSLNLLHTLLKRS
jgi:hypothetical protein